MFIFNDIQACGLREFLGRVGLKTGTHEARVGALFDEPEAGVQTQSVESTINPEREPAKKPETSLKRQKGETIEDWARRTGQEGF